jgi:lipoyl(octanoyl) transferase
MNNTLIKKKINWHGLVDYEEALVIQDQAIKDLSPNEIHLLGFEFPTVITLGRRGSVKADILCEERDLKEKKIKVLKVERGGEATLHNPGQLVIYPIVPINNLKIKVKDFVCRLEKHSLHILKEHFNINARTQGHEPGIYTEIGKLIFLGLKIQEGISTHGLAINIQNNLDDFKLIRSCGVKKQKLDKLDNYNAINTQEFFKIWCDELIL